jgi:hypothetical protein
MKMKKLTIYCVLVFSSLSFCSIAAADEIADLKKQLAEMQQKIEQLEARQKQQDEQIEAQKKEQDKQIEQKVSEAVEKKGAPALPDSLKWAERIKFNADLRYRYEYIDEDGLDNRNRNRIRARIGATAKVNDDVDAGIRLATSEETSSGNGDPVSTNQTLDDVFSKKSIWLDLAYFMWHPQSIPGLNVIGGKMETPFLRVGGNQLIFDSDLTPEGIAAQKVYTCTERDEVFVNGGGFWINEVSQGADTALWGIQSGLKHTFENKSALTGGASYYSYGNIEGSGPLVGSGFQGNSNAGGLFVSDIDTAEIFGEYGFEYGQRPAALFANYVNNTSSATSDDTGWLIGAKYNKCKDPGSWELAYDYRDLQADAVLGAINDSDFLGGGTNGKGHRFSGTYQLAKNVQGALTYFLNEKSDDDHDYHRLQTDLIFKF